jgi:hypothetical protein
MTSPANDLAQTLGAHAREVALTVIKPSGYARQIGTSGFGARRKSYLEFFRP